MTRWSIGTAGVALLAAVATAGCGGVRSHPGAPPLEAVGFSCRLPVGSDDPAFGGFVDFPGGTFTPVPRSGSTYLRGPDRWVSDASALSPDHTAFVRAEFIKVPAGVVVHIVDAASGADRAAWPLPGSSSVLGWLAGGIYTMREPAVGGEAHPGPELWLLDPATGRERMVADQPRWGSGVELFKAGAVMGGGAAWSTAGPLYRVDLETGRPEYWGDYQHGQFDVVGFDSGGHVLIAKPDGSLVRLVAPRKTEAIGTAGTTSAASMWTWSLTDAHGTWAAGLDGSIWLLDTPSRMKLVARIRVPVPPSPSPGPADDMMRGPSAPRPVVAGACA